MLPDLTMIVLVTASALALLSIVNLLMAARNDRAATAAGPIEELAVYEARLKQKDAMLRDIEAELEERRKALADVAGVQAEVDALVRQREALLAEWATMDERRKEVQEVRADMEAAMTERQTLEAELIERREEYLAVKERLEKAERLVQQVSALTTEKEELDRNVDALRDEVRRLRDAEKRVTDLDRRTLDLETDLARKDGLLLAREADLADLSERLVAERARVAESAAALSGVQADRAAEVQALARVKAEVAELQERSDALRSQVAACEAALARKETEFEQLHARTENIRQTMADQNALKATLDDGLAETRAKLASVEGAVADRRGKLDALDGRIIQKEARLAALEDEIGAASGTGESTVDPLKELREQPPVIVELARLPEVGRIPEAEAIHNVELRLRAFGLEYHPRVLRAFHTAMKVNESTQMAVLAGISGTGKSQLPRQYASAMGIGFLQVPVQPRWDSPQDLMGFYNYIEGKFRPTDMARALWALDGLNNDAAVEDRMMMILLDEMNLARVEYYFSDFLSRLESRPARDSIGDKGLRKDAEIELEIPKLAQPPRIFPGYNLLFAGTMNEDESTQSLSDKVVDRANILRFAAPKKIEAGRAQGQAPEVRALSLTQWQRWVRPVATVRDDRGLKDNLERMVDLMRDFGRPVGHRLGRAIMDYVANYPELDGVDPARVPLADQVEMRLLPKLRGVETEENAQTFEALQAFVETELGDAVLAEAIKTSREAAETTGQFVWSGVTR